MGIKYRKGKDGDREVVPFEGVKMVGCCDCGLVHKHVYSVENERVVERTYRNERATAQMRRKLARDHEILAEPKSNAYIIVRRIVGRRKFRKIKIAYEPYR